MLTHLRTIKYANALGISKNFRKVLAKSKRLIYNMRTLAPFGVNMGMYRLRRCELVRRKAGGRVGYLKTQKAIIANKNENAKVVKFAAPVANNAMAFAA